MGFGIHACHIEHGDQARGEIRSIKVCFGDGHELEIDARSGPACLRLHNAALTVALLASGPQCQYERAVNLLRLHMPAAGEA